MSPDPRSAREQASSLKEISAAADQMDKVTQQNAAMVEQSTAAAQTLSTETDELATMVSYFRTNGASTPPSSARSLAKKRQPSAVVQMRTLGNSGAAPKTAAAEEWSEF